MKYAPLSFEELKSLRKPMRNINIEHHKKLSQLDKIALLVTNHVGTMGFFILIVLWTVCWLAWNIFAPVGVRFDPYPAFVLWLFISNMIQLLLLPLIMVGQHFQEKHAQARAEADFEVNVKAEREIEAIMQHLENQHDMITQILDHLKNTQET